MVVIYENTDLFPTAEDGTHAESGSVALEPKTEEFEELLVV